MAADRFEPAALTASIDLTLSDHRQIQSNSFFLKKKINKNPQTLKRLNGFN